MVEEENDKQSKYVTKTQKEKQVQLGTLHKKRIPIEANKTNEKTFRLQSEAV